MTTVPISLLFFLVLMRIPDNIVRSMGSARAPLIAWIEAERAKQLEFLTSLSIAHSVATDTQMRVVAAAGATVAIYGELLASLRVVDSHDASPQETISEHHLI